MCVKRIVFVVQLQYSIRLGDSTPPCSLADVYVEGFAGGAGCDRNYWLQAVEEEEVVVEEKDKGLGQKKVVGL